MAGPVEIDSEKTTEVQSDVGLGPSNHCILIVEQSPLEPNRQVPRWRVSVTLTLVNPSFGKDPIRAELPPVQLPPLLQKQQIAAIAKYPFPVRQWLFRFECDSPRAKGKVWLHVGTAPTTDCGLFAVSTE